MMTVGMSAACRCPASVPNGTASGTTAEPVSVSMKALAALSLCQRKRLCRDLTLRNHSHAGEVPPLAVSLRLCRQGLEQLGVVETGRRRRWTDDEKLKIVLES